MCSTIIKHLIKKSLNSKSINQTLCVLRNRLQKQNKEEEEH